MTYSIWPVSGLVVAVSTTERQFIRRTTALMNEELSAGAIL
jgi:hypothetical protein